MNKKKEAKIKGSERPGESSRVDGEEERQDGFGKITSKQELKAFLNSIRDKVTDNAAAPIYVMAAMNHVLTMPEIYSLLDNENKEIARDIMLRLKQSGLQTRMPGLLFEEDEIIPSAGN